MGDAVVERVARRVIEDGWNRGDMTAIDEVVHPDYVRHMSTATLTSADEFKGWIAGARRTFPELAVTIEEIISDAGRGAVRTTVRGTHPGVEVTSLVVIHVVDGLLVEEWEQRDDLALMGSTGQLPPREASR